MRESAVWIRQTCLQRAVVSMSTTFGGVSIGGKEGCASVRVVLVAAPRPKAGERKTRSCRQTWGTSKGKAKEAGTRTRIGA